MPAHLLVWTGFSLLAALAQWRLHAAALMSPSMARTNAVLSGALLVAAGVFQFTPVKKACLRRCRARLEDGGGPCGPPNPLEDGGGPPNPLASAVSGSENRPRGAFLMGLTHGAFSAGSCAALMLVLFVTGVMSFLWMAILTGFLVLERIPGRAVDQPGGGSAARRVGRVDASRHPGLNAGAPIASPPVAVRNHLVIPEVATIPLRPPRRFAAVSGAAFSTAATPSLPGRARAPRAASIELSRKSAVLARLAALAAPERRLRLERAWRKKARRALVKQFDESANGICSG